MFLGITCQSQVQISLLPLKRYDFSFALQNKIYLLEFDGQQSDVLKTYTAMQSGYYIIRIDYTQINSIEYHIRNALATLGNGYSLYTSNTSMYKYILDTIQAITYIL